jgi:uncharacterized protein (DUF2384 family)
LDENTTITGTGNLFADSGLPDADKRLRRVRDSVELGKAVLGAAHHLALSNRAVGQILGISEARVSRLTAGDVVFAADQFERAQQLVRLFCSLDSMTGFDKAASQSWLRTDNIRLGGKPIDLMATNDGLGAVLNHLERGSAA